MSGPRVGWVTNDPCVADKLRNADRAFEASRSAARNLPLAEKVVALREAKATLSVAYAEAVR